MDASSLPIARISVTPAVTSKINFGSSNKGGRHIGKISEDSTPKAVTSRKMFVLRSALLGILYSLILGAASLPSIEARPGKIGWLEDSPTGTMTGGLTISHKGTHGFRVLLESALSEASTLDSSAAQSTSDRGNHPEEIATPVNSVAETASASDLELLNNLAGVLAAHAYKYNLGSSITAGTDPTAPFDLFKSGVGLILTFAQRHHMWGCEVNGPCHFTIYPSPGRTIPGSWQPIVFLAILFVIYTVTKDHNR